MEKALYALSLKDIKSAAGKYSRVYFGAEFCQWRMPSPAVSLKAFDAAREAGVGFTLMTPWVTDAGLRKVAAVLKMLAASGDEKFEVVVNDLGVLTLLKEEYPGLTPVLGRLLVKQKRCPRVPGIMEGLPDAGREVYLSAGTEDKSTMRLLRGYGVKRVELDNPLQGLEADLKGVRMKGSIYTPYAYVTTTRNCPASFDGTGWQAYDGCKLKGCMQNVLVLANPAHEGRLLMRGNTQFVENYDLPANLKGMGIDRIVEMEDVP